MEARNLYVGSFQVDLEEALDSAVLSSGEHHRLTSIYVLVPTHILGRHLMWTLARRHGVCPNVRFMTFPELAEIVGIQDIVALKHLPMPALADFLISRKAVNVKLNDKSYFGRVN